MRRWLCLVAVFATVSALALGGVAHAAAPRSDTPTADAGTSQPFTGADPQIVGGGIGSVVNYPWMAALLLSDVSDPFQAQFCGGSLIDPRYILTAAHCITNFDHLTASDVEVALGNTDLDNIDDNATERIPVTSITYAPGWPGTTEVQHIVVDATGGTFTVTWNGQTTAPLAFNISGAAFTTALENLSNIAPGDVVVTGGPGDAGGNNPYVLTWAASLGNVPLPTTPGTAEVQHIVVDATGGTFTVTWNGQTTAPLAFNISGAAFTTALQNLSNINPGEVVVTGGPGDAGGNNPYVLTWAASLGNVALPTTTATNLTGGAHTATPTDVVPFIPSPATPSNVVPDRLHDLALLQLATPATGVPTVAYATDTSREGLNQPAIILGWGAIDTAATVFSDVLRGAGIKVLAPPPPTAGNTTCGTYNSLLFIPAQHICAGVSQTGGVPDNCVFDDGGPLAVGNPGGWTLIGVTTDIGPCGSGNPSLYARVSADTSWITGILDPTPSTVGTYHPIDPVRIVDTRLTTDKLAAGKVGPQSTIMPQVAGFTGTPVPITGANAVVVNVAVTAPTKAGWLTLYPTGQPSPTAANLNFVAGQTVPNLATVQLGQGKFSVGNSVGNTAAGSVHIIIDLVGWYGTDTSGALFHEMAPNRIVDTRFGTVDNPGASKVLQNSPLTATVCAGSTGVADDATAVVVNASVVAGNTFGWLTLWPTGAAPTASNLNYTANLQIANLAIVKVGPTCTIQVGNSTGALDGHAGVHVILDVVGWFGPLNTPAEVGGKQFHAMAPSRIADTRPTSPQPAANPTWVGALGPEATRDDVIACGAPTPASGTAVAVILNLVATGPTKAGWLTLYPGDVTLPEASNLLFAAGQTVPNLAIVKVKTANCSVRVTNSQSPSLANPNAGSTHVVIDLMGWFE